MMVKQNCWVKKLVICIFAISSFVFAEWTGDTLAPKKVDGCYQISSPEEYVWIAAHSVQNDHCFKLVSDIVFGKDKKTVNREHPVGMLFREYIDLDFNGFSVYGAYSEKSAFIRCVPQFQLSAHFKNISFKNFEIHAKDTTWRTEYGRYISAFMLDGCPAEGNVVAEGAIKVTGDTLKYSVHGGSFVDGVLENRTSITVDGKVGNLNVFGNLRPGYLGIDSSLVREAVNYADISIKLDLGDVAVYGVCPTDFYSLFVGSSLNNGECQLNENFYKLSNYGNISVDISGGVGTLAIAGVGNFKGHSSPNVYNEGNISVKTGSVSSRFYVAGISNLLETFDSSGLSFVTYKYARAVNKGNIELITSKVGNGYDSYLGGCFARSNAPFEDAVNEGNIHVQVGTFVPQMAIRNYIGGVVGGTGYLSDVANLGSVQVSYESKYEKPDDAPIVGGIAGRVGFSIHRAFNFGTVEGTNVGYLGGVGGLLYSAEADKLMNFGAVKGSGVSSIGGVMGLQYGSCSQTTYGYRCNDSIHQANLANLGRVTADSSSLSIGGLAGESTSHFLNSYNAAKVEKVISPDSVAEGHPFANNITRYKNIFALMFKQTFYDWNVYYGTHFDRSVIRNRDNALTTDYMQSKTFVKDLNYVDSTNTDSKVWTLTKLYPYPIIADMEVKLEKYKGKLSVPLQPFNKMAASFGVQVEGLNLYVLNARIGSSYVVLDLLGKTVLSGKIGNSRYLIPMSKAGAYIVKIGKVSQKVLVK